MNRRSFIFAVSGGAAALNLPFQASAKSAVAKYSAPEKNLDP